MFSLTVNRIKLECQRLLNGHFLRLVHSWLSALWASWTSCSETAELFRKHLGCSYVWQKRQSSSSVSILKEPICKFPARLSFGSAGWGYCYQIVLSHPERFVPIINLTNILHRSLSIKLQINFKALLISIKFQLTDSAIYSAFISWLIIFP